MSATQLDAVLAFLQDQGIQSIEVEREGPAAHVTVTTFGGEKTILHIPRWEKAVGSSLRINCVRCRRLVPLDQTISDACPDCYAAYLAEQDRV